MTIIAVRVTVFVRISAYVTCQVVFKNLSYKIRSQCAQVNSASYLFELDKTSAV